MPQRLRTREKRAADLMVGTQAVAEEIQSKIRLGLPEVGWDGDPWLTLVYNKLYDRYEVWDEIAERPRLVCSKSRREVGERINDAIYALCRGLARGDLRRRDPEDILAEVDEHNDKIEADMRRYYGEQMSAAADKLDWALKKDLGTDYQGDRPTQISLATTK